MIIDNIYFLRFEFTAKNNLILVISPQEGAQVQESGTFRGPRGSTRMVNARGRSTRWLTSERVPSAVLDSGSGGKVKR